jgi:mannose-6-phosphate isomerase-like protein (cupin superfamily)
MIPEAKLEETEHGLVAVTAGWFVVNARDARWRSRPGRRSVSFTGADEWPADTLFPMLGVNLAVLEPGEPNSQYHWETEAEAFFVISGEALLIVEGQERPLRRWDFVHLPPETRHVIVGAGERACLVLAVGARDRTRGDAWGGYPVDEAAGSHGASVEQDTTDPAVAYAGLPPREPVSYREGWLPG